MLHQGGCHCGAVKFEFEADTSAVVYQCNCSICTLTGFLHLIIPRRAFNLLTPRDNLSTYTFNTGLAKHRFCRRCGIKSFYVPRSNPMGISVHFRCVEEGTFTGVKIEPFDGKNWEQQAGRLSHLSD